MADTLTLKGVDVVTNHTGTEMQLKRGKKAGSTAFPKWWDRRGQVQYVDCTIFRVDIGTAFVRLVIPCGRTSTLDIRHDGAGNFTFGPAITGPERAAVFPDDSSAPAQLIHEYQFPKISGGAVLKRTPGSLPSSSTTLGTATVTGDATAAVSDNKVYTVAISGDASNLAYAWTVPGGGGVIPGATNAASATVTWAAAGSRTAQCVVTSTDPALTGPTSATGTKSVTVSA